MNFDMIIRLIVYMCQKANENTLVIVPLVSVVYYLNVKIRKTWTYQTDKYLGDLDELVDGFKGRWRLSV